MSASATLTEQYILDILSQESQGAEFPIDFDDIWQSSGYTEKRNAVRFLTERCGAIEGEDYTVCSERSQTPQGGRPSQLIRLSSDGYEYFLSKSNTDQGNANLRCLIQIKKAYLRQLERQLNAPASPVTDSEAKQWEQWISQLEQENKELKEHLEKEKKETKDFLESQLKSTARIAHEFKKFSSVNKWQSKRIAELEEEVARTEGYANYLDSISKKLICDNERLSTELETERDYRESAVAIVERFRESLKGSVDHYANELSYLVDYQKYQ